MQPATLESGNAIPLLRTLGIRLTEIGDCHAVMEVDVTDKHSNYFGGAHGGLIATLVDVLGIVIYLGLAQIFLLGAAAAMSGR